MVLHAWCPLLVDVVSEGPNVVQECQKVSSFRRGQQLCFGLYIYIGSKEFQCFNVNYIYIYCQSTVLPIIIKVATAPNAAFGPIQSCQGSMFIVLLQRSGQRKFRNSKKELEACQLLVDWHTCFNSMRILEQMNSDI